MKYIFVQTEKGIGETGAEIICEAFKCNNCSLTELNLRGDEMKEIKGRVKIEMTE